MNKYQIIQQPFYLKRDRLYISDNLAKSLSITTNYKNKYNDIWFQNNLKHNEDFFNGNRYTGKYTGHKRNFILTNYNVKFQNMYSMNITVRRGNMFNNEHGTFKYYIGGNSGDTEMHGKNKIRITRECNFNFIYKIYPFTLEIKDLKKQLKEHKLFIKIISKCSNLPPDFLRMIRFYKIKQLNK